MSCGETAYFVSYETRRVGELTPISYDWFCLFQFLRSFEDLFTCLKLCWDILGRDIDVLHSIGICDVVMSGASGLLFPRWRCIVIGGVLNNEEPRGLLVSHGSDSGWHE